MSKIHVKTSSRVTVTEQKIQAALNVVILARATVSIHKEEKKNRILNQKASLFIIAITITKMKITTY